jgi:hypothetical protein
MIGIRCKRLPAAESSIAVSSALLVGEARLMDRRRGNYSPLVNRQALFLVEPAANRRSCDFLGGLARHLLCFIRYFK